ncbi:hypothetical protein J7L18_00145 [Candidatus Bathyarchaeota archaeon]|nr:hypothetical protein [Candidatus Bathyarchaeota archaeon]
MTRKNAEAETKKYPSDKVIQALTNLQRGDKVAVYWQDVCGFRDVPVPEEIYYTPKMTIGSFYTLIDDHLIIISEETGRGESYEGTVIPIGIIERIEVLSKSGKRSKKVLKQKLSVLHSYPLKTIVETVKICIHEGKNP